jgi:hypothetical protein
MELSSDQPLAIDHEALAKQGCRYRIIKITGKRPECHRGADPLCTTPLRWGQGRTHTERAHLVREATGGTSGVNKRYAPEHNWRGRCGLFASVGQAKGGRQGLGGGGGGAMRERETKGEKTHSLSLSLSARPVGSTTHPTPHIGNCAQTTPYPPFKAEVPPHGPRGLLPHSS